MQKTGRFSVQGQLLTVDAFDLDGGGDEVMGETVGLARGDEPTNSEP